MSGPRRQLRELTLEEAESYLDTWNTLIDQTDSAQKIAKSAKQFLSKFQEIQDLAARAPEVVMTTLSTVLSLASYVSYLRGPDTTMADIQKSLNQINAKIDKILATPLKKALDNFEYAMNLIVTGCYESAFEKLGLVQVMMMMMIMMRNLTWSR